MSDTGASTSNALPDVAETFADHWDNIREKLAEELPGLRVKSASDQKVDDGGQEIQTECVVFAKTHADVERVAAIALREGYGLMPIAAKTSAIGAFEVNGRARQYGLKGYIGIQVEEAGSMIEKEGKEYGNGYTVVDRDPLTVQDGEGYKFEVISVCDGSAEILKSENPKTVAHRIRTWVGLKPHTLNMALREHLGPGHSVGVTLTTIEHAQMGGVAATGAQGPDRLNLGHNIRSSVLVDNKGKKRELNREASLPHFGMNGTTGMFTELELDVVREGATEIGFFLPLRVPAGVLSELEAQHSGDERALTTAVKDTIRLQVFPKVLSCLDRLTESQEITDEQGKLLVAKLGNFLLKGFEIMTRDEIEAGKRTLNGSALAYADGMIAQLDAAQSKAGLMINASTNLEAEALTDFLGAFMGETYEGDEPLLRLLFTLFEEELAAIPVSDGARDVVIFSDEDQTGISDLSDFKALRETIAEAARASKDRGFSKSTDLNLRLTRPMDDPRREEDYRKIWEIYAKYIDELEAEGFTVYVYGHMHPGNVVQDSEDFSRGGFDPHVRASYEFKSHGVVNEEMQAVAIQKYNYLQKRHARLYAELMELGLREEGIEMMPGEKGVAINPAMLRLWEEYFPERAEKVWQLLDTSGGILWGARCKLQFHHHPPRMPEGLLGYFGGGTDEEVAQNILKWCQYSHRSPEGKRVLFETMRLLREYFECQPQERIFYEESLEKAVITSIRNMCDRESGKNFLDMRGVTEFTLSSATDTVVIDSDQAAQPELLSSLEGKKIIVVFKNGEIPSAEIRAAVDVCICPADALGGGPRLTLMLTKIQTVRKSINNQKAGNRVGAKSNFAALNELPGENVETPMVQRMAEMGYNLAIGTNKGSLPGARRLETPTTFNPGPTQINGDLLAATAEIRAEEESLSRDLEQRVMRVEKIKGQLRRFLGVPEDYEIFFGGSATQAMEQIAQSIGGGEGVSVSQGAFGDRQREVMHQSGGFAQISNVDCRWGTGPNSQGERVRNDIPRNASSIWVTGHETSTGVQVNTNRLFEGLDSNTLRVVDGTSEIGGIPRKFREGDETLIDVYFGSVQKFMGLPAGLSIMAVSPRAMRVAIEKKARIPFEDRGLVYRDFVDMVDEEEKGEVFDLRAVLQLGRVLENFERRGGADVLRGQVRNNVTLLMDAVKRESALADHLAILPPEEEDQSELLVALTGIDLDVARLREKLSSRGFDLGEGYGALKSSSVRVYLTPEVSTDRVQALIAALKNLVEECTANSGIHHLDRSY